MRLNKQASCLLLVDVQEKLIPAIHEYQGLIDNCAWLMNVANDLHVPIWVSEQYPRGLGPTIQSLQALADPTRIMEKVHFSCGADPSCRKILRDCGRQQVIVIGIEAHVCVLQTAIDLHQLGKNVFVVADAVSSRDPLDKTVALQRMRQQNITIVTKEMVLFEWLEQAGTDVFRHMSKTYLQA